ncbi:hypothetical protein ACFLV3_01625 [Chloroflexota bacterium]
MRIKLREAISLWRRWKAILRSEGLLPFIKHGAGFLIRRFISYQTYYLYKVTVKEEAEKSVPSPRIDKFTLKIISSNRQLDGLINDDFDFGYLIVQNDERLNRGAMAFCIFVERKLAHISWVVGSEEAKSCITDIPCHTDFSVDEVYLGRTIRNPRYWRGGFSVYVYQRIMQSLWRSGAKTCRFVVSSNNRVTLNALAKRVNVQPYGKGHYFRIAWLKFWREKPANGALLVNTNSAAAGF